MAGRQEPYRVGQRVLVEAEIAYITEDGGTIALQLPVGTRQSLDVLTLERLIAQRRIVILDDE